MEEVQPCLLEGSTSWRLEPARRSRRARILYMMTFDILKVRLRHTETKVSYFPDTTSNILILNDKLLQTKSTKITLWL